MMMLRERAWDIYRTHNTRQIDVGQEGQRDRSRERTSERDERERSTNDIEPKKAHRKKGDMYAGYSVCACVRNRTATENQEYK